MLLMPWYRRYAWLLVVVLAGALVAFGAYVLISPVNADDVAREAGVNWDAFTVREPAMAEYLEREARLLATAMIGLGLMTAVLAAGRLRRGDLGTWRILWIFPLVLAMITIVFFASDAPTLGWYYLVLTLVAAAGLWMAAPRRGRLFSA